MHPQLTLVNGINPRLTEEFLLNQPNVADASVWYTRGHLKAHVVVLDNSRVQEDELKEACALMLGDNQAPSELELVYIRDRAA